MTSTPRHSPFKSFNLIWFFEVSAINTSNSSEPLPIFNILAVLAGFEGFKKEKDSRVKDRDSGIPCSTAIVVRIMESEHGPITDFALYQPSSSANTFDGMITVAIITAEILNVRLRIPSSKFTDWDRCRRTNLVVLLMQVLTSFQIRFSHLVFYPIIAFKIS